MPTLDWLNRANALLPNSTAEITWKVPGERITKHFGPPFVLTTKGAHLLNDPYEIEKRQIGELWARKSEKRGLFGQIALQRDGVGMSGQLDTLLR